MAIVEYVSPEERKKITDQMTEALYRGASDEELDAIDAKMPIYPWMAKSLKESRGLDGLLATDFNLYDAVQEYGEDFLKR